MSIECRECEQDARRGHAECCTIGMVQKQQKNKFKTVKDLKIEELERQLTIANARISDMLKEHSEFIDKCTNELKAFSNEAE